MRVNVYTEELNANFEPKMEIVEAEYISWENDKRMINYGLRIYLKSAPELHRHFKQGPGGAVCDDDRSAVTFWCGDKRENVYAFVKELLAVK